jgi:hypothetical protein
VQKLREGFLDLPWNLAECAAHPFAKRFAIHGDTKAGEIDVSERGQMKIAFVAQLQDQLTMAIQEPAWTLPRLVNWIERGIPHPDVTKPAAKVFIQRALEAVMEAKGYSLDQLARYKYELRRTLGDEIQTLRAEREKGNYMPSSRRMLVLLKPVPTWRFCSTNKATLTICRTRARESSTNITSQLLVTLSPRAKNSAAPCI